MMRTSINRSNRSKQPGHPPPWRRILVPVDFSKTSLRALDVAVPLARDHGAQLFLLAVVETAAYASGMESISTPLTDATLVEEARANLPTIAARFVPPSVNVTILVRRGRVFDVITRVAREKKIDLIVLTTHGRTGLDRFLIGSTAERVVRHAHCPVYVVRSSGASRRVRR